jgi:Peptidase family M23/Transglycosylase SLT domain
LNYDGHPGIDYAIEIETEIRAAAAGVVDKETNLTGLKADGTAHPNGIHVKINHPEGYQTAYCHLSKIEENIAPGGKVGELDLIGLSGNTGKSDGPHLHFHVYRVEGVKKSSVDPYGWRGGYADPRLAIDSLAPSAPLWRDSTPITTLEPEVLPVTSAGSSSAGTISIGVTGGSYTAVVTNGGDWLSLASGAVGGGSGSLVVATTTNSGAGRTGAIRITNSVGAVKTVSVVQEEAASSTNPTPSQIAAQILIFSNKYQIPAPIIAAVMAQESSWRQFDSGGLPLASKTSDVGIMQLNLSSSGVDAVRASRDWVYNLEEGCKILRYKFGLSASDTASPFDSLEDKNPAIFENWFYAVAWYNGEGGAAYDYVTRVWGFLRQLPSPASVYFSSIPTIGDPTRLQGFPRVILSNINVNDASLNESEYIRRGGTSLLLLRKSGESIHSWNWLANSVAAGPLSQALLSSSEPLPAPPVVDDVIDITANIALVPISRTYDEWKFTPGFPIGYEVPSADPDGDGMTNLVEFAFGTDPTSKDIVPPFGIDTSQSPPRFVYKRAKHTLGVALSVEGSTTLNGWSGTYVQKSLREESSSIQTWEAFLPSATKGFFRLRLFDPPADIDSDGIIDSWETNVFGSLDNMSPSSDYGKTGISDFLKFATGIDPRHPDWSALPRAEIAKSGGKAYSGFHYRRFISPGLLVYQVGVSDDLVFWDWTGTKIEQVGLPTPTGDGLTEDVTVRLKVPVEGLSGSKFMRMRVLVDQ